MDTVRNHRDLGFGAHSGFHQRPSPPGPLGPRRVQVGTEQVSATVESHRCPGVCSRMLRTVFTDASYRVRDVFGRAVLPPRLSRLLKTAVELESLGDN